MCLKPSELPLPIPPACAEEALGSICSPYQAGGRLLQSTEPGAKWGKCLSNMYTTWAPSPAPHTKGSLSLPVMPALRVQGFPRLHSKFKVSLDYMRQHLIMMMMMMMNEELERWLSV